MSDKQRRRQPVFMERVTLQAQTVTAIMRELHEIQTRNERLCEMLATLLDQVDYTSGNCRLTEQVGAVLPARMIAEARTLLLDEQIAHARAQED